MSIRSSRRERSAPARLLPSLAGLLLAFASAAIGQETDAAGIEYALQKPLASRSLLLDGVAVGDLMVVVGERGHVLTSRDDGVSWQQATTVPTRALLTGVFFHDEKLGWAVGHDAVILRTRDGGDNWERLHWAPEEERPFLDVWFRDARNGFAVGAYGFFLQTTDGGDSWTPLAIAAAEDLVDEETYLEEADDYLDQEEYLGEDAFYGGGADFHLNHVARSSSGRLYIAAEAGTVYRSEDDGESWRSLPSPYDGSFFATLPLDGDSLLLLGLRGHLYRSDDAGESWQEIPTGTQASLTDALRLRDGTVIVAGLAGTLLVSSDGGHTFDLRQQPDRQGLARVLEAADGGLVLVGENGVRRLPADAWGRAGAP